MKNTNYDYILEKYNIENYNKNNKPSSYILELFALDNYPLLYNKSVEIQEYFGINKTIYGIKKKNNKFSLEYYFYYYNENTRHNIENIQKFLNYKNKININNKYYLLSFEINDNNLDNVEEINAYYTKSDCKCDNIGLYHDIFEICDTCLTCFNFSYNIKNNKKIFKNTYKFFFKKNDYLLVDYIKSLFKDNVNINDILKPYCLNYKKSICVSQKPNNIGFYISQIPFDDFILFLNDTNFDASLTEKIIKNKDKLSYLLFDIGFDITIENNSIKYNKLSFYGVL